MSRKRPEPMPEKPLSGGQFKRSKAGGPADSGSDGPEQASSWSWTTGSAYELGEPLGEGGMGLVYRGVDRRLGRAVALKVLRPELSTERYRRKLEQEARLLAQLEHPGIVRLYALSAHHGQPMLVMELVEQGITLARKLLQPQIPLSEVLEIGVQAFEALAYAHEKRVLHLDLSPGNVLLVPNGGAPTGPRIRVKLLDFGIAGTLAAEAPGVAGIGALTGIPWFNPTYASPEQRRGEPLDERSDLYSLSLLLWRMVVGEPPFLLTELEIHPDWRHVRLFRPEVPLWLDELIAQGLEPARAQRMASAHAILTRLSEQLETFGPPTPLDGTRPAAGLLENGWSSTQKVAAVPQPFPARVPVLGIKAEPGMGEHALTSPLPDAETLAAAGTEPSSTGPGSRVSRGTGAALGLVALLGMGLVAAGAWTRGGGGVDSSAEPVPGETPSLRAGGNWLPTPGERNVSAAVSPGREPSPLVSERAGRKSVVPVPASAPSNTDIPSKQQVRASDQGNEGRAERKAEAGGAPAAVPPQPVSPQPVSPQPVSPQPVSPQPVSPQSVRVSQDGTSRVATLEVQLLREDEKEDVPLSAEAVLHTRERLFFRVLPSAAGRLWIFQCQPDNRMRPWRQEEGGGKALEGIPLVAHEWQEVPAKSAFQLDGVQGWERFAFVFAVAAAPDGQDDLSRLTQTLLAQKRCQSELRTDVVALRGSVLVPRKQRAGQTRDLPPQPIQWQTDPEGILLQTLRYRHE